MVGTITKGERGKPILIEELSEHTRSCRVVRVHIGITSDVDWNARMGGKNVFDSHG